MTVELLFLSLVCACIAGAVGHRKGEAVTGFIVGALLVPIGVIIAMASGGNRVKCPHCRERIDPQATICPRCRSFLGG